MSSPDTLERAIAATPVRLRLWELYHAPWRIAQRWIADVRARVVTEREYQEPIRRRDQFRGLDVTSRDVPPGERYPPPGYPDFCGYDRETGTWRPIK